ncbi:putative RNA methyltransferase [Promicromonospora citrea]|uniref:Ubiquinone biosynthesis protein n=1 Tax=Promicromonospora citrea TaxID=43677 RepID=A0A8H9GG41_9MICO|nr:methyltransferase type 11 [Promicromonospora citrea]NNH51644.1 methyltransferase type 11 [Promicromonospora citrea]GGM22625.1 ubiquinone biosynthesis protein [Promicromonospora citrea]
MPTSLPAALDLVLPLLRCPACAAPLSAADRALRCPERHSFDVARHGYAGLLTGARATSGDDGPMARARRDFLAAGRYAPVRDAVAELAVEAVGGTARHDGRDRVVVDVGCGTGYYLAGVLDALAADAAAEVVGLGLDTSAHALRVAAKAHPRAAAATWDVFRPFPVVSEGADVLLDVFAPRNPAEFHRVLRPGGALVVVRPFGGHLAELRRQVARMVAVDPDKERRLHAALDPYLVAGPTREVRYTTPLTRQEATDLVLMTPSARHVSAAELSADDLPDEVTVSVLATVYRRR